MAIKIITVSRQFGSGGRTVAKEIADKFGFDYYDKEIIDNVAMETGFSKEFIASKGEEAPGRTIFSYGFEAAGVPGIMNGMTTLDYIYTVQRKIILNIAEKDRPAIIVGRCADYILRDREDAFHTFIYADLKYRAERIVKMYGESENKPEKRLIDKDKKRSANYKHFTDREWGKLTNYDICLNSGYLGVEGCVKILSDIIAEKNGL